MSAKLDFDLKIVKTRENKLLGRTEIIAEIYHLGKGTPSRHMVRQRIAEMLGKPINAVYVRKLLTEYGLGKTIGEIHIYQDPSLGERIEPEYIRIRNLPPEERRKILEARRGAS